LSPLARAWQDGVARRSIQPPASRKIPDVPRRLGERVESTLSGR
jgi:hypothetical protein